MRSVMLSTMALYNALRHIRYYVLAVIIAACSLIPPLFATIMGGFIGVYIAIMLASSSMCGSLAADVNHFRHAWGWDHPTTQRKRTDSIQADQSLIRDMVIGFALLVGLNIVMAIGTSLSTMLDSPFPPIGALSTVMWLLSVIAAVIMVVISLGALERSRKVLYNEQGAGTD